MPVVFIQGHIIVALFCYSDITNSNSTSWWSIHATFSLPFVRETFSFPGAFKNAVYFLYDSWALRFIVHCMEHVPRLCMYCSMDQRVCHTYVGIHETLQYTHNLLSCTSNNECEFIIGFPTCLPVHSKASPPKCVLCNPLILSLIVH